MLGVLVITGEYTTGMIRSTFCAVPKRLPVLWAQGHGVRRASTFVLSLPAVLIAFFAGQAILSSRAGDPAHRASPTPASPRAVIGAALFLTVMGLFGLGLGAIVRHTAGGIVAFVGDPLRAAAAARPAAVDWANAINPYLPSSAGDVLWTIHAGRPHARAVGGLRAVLRLRRATLAIAAVLLRRRDT